jgi:hypothetical protein
VEAPVTPGTEQQMTALEKGNAIRMTRAKLKREVRHSNDPCAGVVEVLREAKPPDWLDGMKVRELLREVSGLGKKRVAYLMAVARCDPEETFGGLSARQRDALIEALLSRDARVRRHRR